MVCESLELVRRSVLNVPLRRRKDVNGQYPRGAWYVSPTTRSWVSLTMGEVAIQEIAEGVNRMKRSFFWSLRLSVAG